MRGVELPSFKVTPELSFEASIDRPQVSGGVSPSFAPINELSYGQLAVVDRNFLGLGNKLELVVLKKGTLPPIVLPYPGQRAGSQVPVSSLPATNSAGLTRASSTASPSRFV